MLENQEFVDELSELIESQILRKFHTLPRHRIFEAIWHVNRSNPYNREDFLAKLDLKLSIDSFLKEKQ